MYIALTKLYDVANINEVIQHYNHFAATFYSHYCRYKKHIILSSLYYINKTVIVLGESIRGKCFLSLMRNYGTRK